MPDNPTANPTSAATVRFLVTFSKPVTGVDITDFAVTAPGLTSPSVIGVTGSGATRTVTVNTGSGYGSLRLDVLANGTIQDGSSQPLAGQFTSGQAYTITQPATWQERWRLLR